MKKLFSALIILASVLMLSGCFFYVEDNSSSYTPPKYSFYFKNNSSKDLRDFYLEDKDGNKYSKVNDGYANPINRGETLVIKNLEKKQYRIVYQTENYSFFTTEYFPMDSDKTYKVKEDELYRGILD